MMVFHDQEVDFYLSSKGEEVYQERSFVSRDTMNRIIVEDKEEVPQAQKSDNGYGHQVQPSGDKKERRLSRRTPSLHTSHSDEYVDNRSVLGQVGFQLERAMVSSKESLA
jgi:hypothetical protein